MSFLPRLTTKIIVKSENGKSAVQPFEATKISTRPDGSIRLQHSFPGDSRTKNSFVEECNINFIMQRYTKNGTLPDRIREDASYGDYSAAPDFMQAQNLIVRAREQFDSLSSRQRERFGNDPAKFLEFANNAENADEMAKLGLLKPEAVKRVRDQRQEAAKALQAQKSAIPEQNPSPKEKGGKRSVSTPSSDGDQ